MKKWLLFSIIYFIASFCFASPLPAEEIFQAHLKQVNNEGFVIQWTIKPGYFLYKERINLNVLDNNPIEARILRFPAATTKIDAQGKTLMIYRQELTLPVSILAHDAGEFVIDLHYQGCADNGFCYPPQKKGIKLTINKNLLLTQVEFFEPAKASSIIQESTNLDAVFNDHNLIVTFLIFFGFGLLLSFTPCILPMIPVISGIIVGHGGKISTAKAFRLSLTYVLSMSVTYAVVGAFVSLLGSNLQIIMQSPWAVSLFSLVFIALALSMFGFFEFKLPISWQAKLAQLNHRQASGHYLSAAIMGCLSTLILSPCVTAPLIGVLTYIAKTGNLVLGTFGLFFLSLGMGMPLILIGTSAGKWLPKAGHWMNLVKSFFGVLLLGVAIYLLSRLLPAGLTMVLWAALLIFSGIYLGALNRSSSNYEKFCQASGLILLLYGFLILIGASLGSPNPLQPLEKWTTSSSSSTTEQFQTVKTISELEQAMQQAQGKPVMLDFYADWCSSCISMEKSTFKNEEVQALLKSFVVLKVDITANNANSQALLTQYKVIAPPTFLFFNQQGDELEHSRLVGEVNANEFLKYLTNVQTQVN